MRLTPVLLAIIVPSLALAAAAKTKPAVIEKLLKQNITAIAKGEADDKLGFAKDVVKAVPGGVYHDPDMGITTFAGGYYAGSGGTTKHTLGKATLSIDDAKGIAYFQAPFEVSIVWSGGGGGDSFKGTERIGGIALRDGTTWQLAAVMYSRHLDRDKRVIESAGLKRVELPKGEPKISGDATLGAMVRGWFKTGFAPNIAKTGTRIASGTAPREFQVGAGAEKLAKAWDKLGLAVHSIEVTQLAGGAIAFAQADVVWPSKNQLVPMLLGIVLVPDGKDWRWVSMQFSPI